MGTIFAPTYDSAYIHSYAMAFPILTIITQSCQLTIRITHNTLYNCTKIGTVRRQTYRTGWAVLLLLQQMSHPLPIRSEWVQKKIAKTIQSLWYKQDNIQRPIQLMNTIFNSQFITILYSVVTIWRMGCALSSYIGFYFLPVNL